MNFFLKSSLDSKVFWSILLLLLVSALFLGYQYSQHIDCENANFVVFAREFSPNKMVEFYDKTDGAKNWEWDFGDSTAVDKRQHTLHAYKKPGEYIVTLTINKSCVHKKLITLTNHDEHSGDLPLIAAPSVATVGKPVQFNAIKEGGVSWEWNFGESTRIDATDQAPSHFFNSEGPKKITLVVNGDVQHSATKTIYVAPAPLQNKPKADISTYEFEKPRSAFSLPMGNPEKDPLVEALKYIPVSPKTAGKKDSVSASKKIPEISNEQFRLLLQQVAAESKTKEDFSSYMCGNFDIPVVVNEKRITSFEQFCQIIAGKKIKISILRIEKGSQNCIEHINIQYKAKKFMVWVKE
ncbi:PKD domain-containing protein [Chryseobacterium rhizoplanae]|uniref:PKD domain-containing protein n=1 Tax=Chryseobacterium rhizoplanae TaxID=1609531 RepID=UPI001CE382D0|nr:PKD domain-containing protein [Chryseobacterium rhizoplanae]UCA61775.1 PKD domain-containing protein [Chryseobacterium rhizoplanae]